MALSSTQRIINDIANIERHSEHKVPPDNFFIVRIETLDESVDLTDFVKRDLQAKYILAQSILCGYVYKNIAYIVYTPIDYNGNFTSKDNIERDVTVEGHYLSGSHQELCSHYASNAAIYTGSQVRCNVYEFSLKAEVLIYLQMLVQRFIKISFLTLSDGTISQRDITNFTYDELVGELYKRSSITWNNINPGERYGTFYKLVVTSDGSKKFKVLSDTFDTPKIDKYTSYLFGL